MYHVTVNENGARKTYDFWDSLKALFFAVSCKTPDNKVYFKYTYIP